MKLEAAWILASTFFAGALNLAPVPQQPSCDPCQYLEIEMQILRIQQMDAGTKAYLEMYETRIDAVEAEISLLTNIQRYEKTKLIRQHGQYDH